jgi:pimeloyl-ACP methyl ester carboxylesterase
VIDKIREDRASFISVAFKGPLGVGNNEVPDKAIERIERMADAADALAIERSVQLFSGYDFSESLAILNRESDLPILLLHGDSDAGSPAEVTARRVTQIIPRSELKLYHNGSRSKCCLFSRHPRCIRRVLTYISL